MKALKVTDAPNVVGDRANIDKPNTAAVNAAAAADLKALTLKAASGDRSAYLELMKRTVTSTTIDKVLA